MNEDLQKQLIRQLKLLNFWITFFGVVFIITMTIVSIMLFKLITFMQDTGNKLESLQQKTQDSLNVKKQICDDDTARRLFSKAVCD